MQAHIVNVGVDTIKFNVKLTDKSGEPLAEQEVNEKLTVLLDEWQEQARMKHKPVETSMTFEYARVMMYPNGASAWKYILRTDFFELKGCSMILTDCVA